MKLEINSRILWIDNVPSFFLCSDGKKDPITPTGWLYYWNNKEIVNVWLIRQFI